MSCDLKVSIRLLTSGYCFSDWFQSSILGNRSYYDIISSVRCDTRREFHDEFVVGWSDIFFVYDLTVVRSDDFNSEFEIEATINIIEIDNNKILQSLKTAII